MSHSQEAVWFAHDSTFEFPLENSVNSYIDPELATAQYISFDNDLSTISEIDRGAELVPMDILSAFCLLILHSDEFELFGFHFYSDQFLSMGCSASCPLNGQLSLIREERSVQLYIDDFLFAGKAGKGGMLSVNVSF